MRLLFFLILTTCKTSLHVSSHVDQLSPIQGVAEGVTNLQTYALECQEALGEMPKVNCFNLPLLPIYINGRKIPADGRKSPEQCDNPSHTAISGSGFCNLYSRMGVLETKKAFWVVNCLNADTDLSTIRQYRNYTSALIIGLGKDKGSNKLFPRQRYPVCFYKHTAGRTRENINYMGNTSWWYVRPTVSRRELIYHWLPPDYIGSGDNCTNCHGAAPLIVTNRSKHLLEEYPQLYEYTAFNKRNRYTVHSNILQNHGLFFRELALPETNHCTRCHKLSGTQKDSCQDMILSMVGQYGSGPIPYSDYSRIAPHLPSYIRMPPAVDQNMRETDWDNVYGRSVSEALRACAQLQHPND